MKSFDCPHCHKIFKSDSEGLELVYCPHCNNPISLPEKDLPAGTVIAGFKIIRLLGKGGMGNVYLSKQISMDRLVALKILLKSFTSDKDAIEQFLNEARVSGRLDHKNIIPAIDAGEFNGLYYLATAYVDGEDLEQRLDRERIIPEKEALQISIKIAKALNYAWDTYGLLHKDIKPGNIMRDNKGEFFLMDMGIAQYIGEVSKQEDHILGSPFYMSPEQTTASRLSWTSDLYSLGATLYNFIVGVPPFDNSEVIEIIKMHTTTPFPEPLTRNPTAEVTTTTVELLRKMLEKKPTERFDSWLGFIEAAENALNHFEPQKRVEKKQPTPKKSKKQKKNIGNRKKNTTTRVIIRKKSNPLITIISYTLMLIIASAVAFIIFNHGKENAGKEAFQRSERFVDEHPGDYESIIDQFQQAKFKCKGTAYETKLSKRIEFLKKEAKTQIHLIDNYNKVSLKASKLAREKKYNNAIKLLINAIEKIKDPDILKDAEMNIKLYKARQNQN